MGVRKVPERAEGQENELAVAPLGLDLRNQRSNGVAEIT